MPRRSLRTERSDARRPRMTDSPASCCTRIGMLIDIQVLEFVRDRCYPMLSNSEVDIRRI